MVSLTKKNSGKDIFIRTWFLLLVAFSAGLFLGCHHPSEYSQYLADLEKWKDERHKSVKAPYGWPSVVGLFPVNNSLQYFGSSKDNEFILPNSAPPSLGLIEKHGDSIVMKASPGIQVSVNQVPHRFVHLSHGLDKGASPVVSWKNLQWYLIKRQDSYFLRVKDTLSTYRNRFDSIAYFPTDTTFRFKAKFTPASPTDSTRYKNILGMSFTASAAGYLHFNYRGEKYRLTALNNDEESYFVIFADQTTGQTTYPGGRYLYPQKAGPNGETWLDFNKSINPPCVFTPYATCPLPPPENHLSFEVKAGEKNIKLY